MKKQLSTNNYDRSIKYEKEDRDGVIAEVRTVDEYQQVSFKIFPLFWTKSSQEQRSAILHEYCHTLSVSMNDLINDMIEGKLVTQTQQRNAWEKTTSRITQLLDAQLRGRNKYARIAYNKYR